MFLTVLSIAALLQEPFETPSPFERAHVDAVAEFVRPAGHELSFEKIAWRNAFWPAVTEARELGRPILLWTMNGHPLGCT